ncbi:MAG TPA: hypothetical protein VEJ63_04715 [Planctomycetota bacterium]|nr:hypothetical protein [Planctomycetota bacterium]
MLDRWFQLAPDSVLAEIQSSRAPAHVPTLAESIARGTIGFALVSLAGFAPWALAGGWFYRTVGEIGLYVLCALVFMIASGLALHRLIIGPRSLLKFYKLFLLAFTLYSAAWIAAWMLIGGTAGSIVGLLAGTAAMAVVLAAAFVAWSRVALLMFTLFTLNAAGYFLGDWAHDWLKGRAGMFLWGLCFGLGLGAALGLCFHLCQREIRRKIVH